MNPPVQLAEFALAAACCRAPGEGRDQAVRAAAHGVDWRRFERVLVRHRVEGLASEALGTAGVVVTDAPTAAGLQRSAAEIALEALRMAGETARLQRALDGAGVANLALKGATLDHLAWGRIGSKRAWDIDLLVAETDAQPARTVLEGAGYDLLDPADPSPGAFRAWVSLSKECVFRHRRNGLVVELHWRLTDAATLLPDLSVRSPAQTLRLSASLTLRTLADEALFAYLCVHGTSHAWSRLKWLADLGAWLARLDEGSRVRLYRTARDLNAGHCPAVALLLCEDVLGLAAPAELAGEIRGHAKVRALAALAIDAMTHGGGEIDSLTRPFFAERILLSHFLFANGWRHIWAEVRRQGVSIDDHMRLGLPPRLAFLYLPLRAPLWIWRRFRRGVAASVRRP